VPLPVRAGDPWCSGATGASRVRSCGPPRGASGAEAAAASPEAAEAATEVGGWPPAHFKKLETSETFTTFIPFLNSTCVF